jgi:prevent-host-death family protein
MKQVNLYEAKTRLSSLVDEAAAGGEIVIAKNGKPMARLVAVGDAATKKEPRKLGQWDEANKNFDWDKWDRDWKTMDKEIEADFEAAIAKPFPRESGGVDKPSRAATPKDRRGFAEDAAPADEKRLKPRGRSGKRKGTRRR